jgi:uncharacterized protein
MTILWIVLAACVVLFVVCTVLVYIFLFRPNILRSKNPAADVPPDEPDFAPYIPGIQSCVDWYKAQPVQQVRMTSYDGLTLAAEYLPAGNAKGTVVCMHGFHSSGMRDFSLAVRYYHENNWNVLLPSQRAHGASEGRYLTFGIRERYDCRDWVRFINRQNGDALPVLLNGVSMGCATVVMASGIDLPANVKCIIADCGFTSPYEEIVHVLTSDMHLPAFPIMLFAGMLTRIIAGFGLREYSTLDAMKVNTLPILFIHGGCDDFVPTEMSRQNYEACRAAKELFIVPEARHAVSYIIDKTGYEKNVSAFIKKYAE